VRRQGRAIVVEPAHEWPEGYVESFATVTGTTANTAKLLGPRGRSQAWPTLPRRDIVAMSATYFEGTEMKFLSTRELRNRPGYVRDLAQKDDLVLTTNGKPIAILLGIEEDEL
jgi:hypothetical protein